ncbi:hypothetical protein Lser_V15G39475 [Lactuca serriola]
MESVESAANLRSQFHEVLRSRRSPIVLTLRALQTLSAEPVVEPLFKGIPVDFEVMRSYPKTRINVEEQLNEENFYLPTEEGEQGCCFCTSIKCKQRAATPFT